MGRGPVPSQAMRHASARGGQAPALRFARPPSYHRRARACPSPSHRSERETAWLACSFRAGRGITGDRPPHYGRQGRLPFTVGRGPVPRQAIRPACVCGGQAPALRFAMPSPFHRRARACPSPSHRVRVRLRGTGPRATVGEAGVLISVGQERLLLRRSGSGAPELQFPLGPLGPKCL